MANGFGFNAWGALGTEAVYGTPQARLQFLELNSFDPGVDDDVVAGNSVYNSAIDIDNIRQGRKKVAPSFSIDLRREGIELLMKYAIGTVAFTTVGAGGTVASRNYTIPDSLGTSLCMEVNADAAAFLMHGLKINEVTFNGDNEGILTADVSAIAEDIGTVSPSTPSFSTSQYWMFQDAGLIFGGTAKNIRSWNLTLSQNLTDDRFHWGSRYINEPLRAGRMEITGEMEIEFTGSSEYNTFQTMGTGAMVATYTGATLDGTVAEKLQFDLPIVRFSGGVPSVSDSGPITVTIPFVAYANGTIKPLNVTLVNSVGTSTGY